MTRVLIASAVAAALAACDVDLERMIEGSRLKPYEATPYLPGGRVAQRPPAGTVSTDRLVAEPALTEGVEENRYVTEIPIEVTRQTLERGRNRYEIFCAACHGVAGTGNTQVAKNMRLRPPPSLLSPRIVAFPPGRLFRVISQGYGLMPAYAEELSTSDRWAVTAYVQVLQLSQGARLGSLPEDARKEAARWLD